MSHRGEGGKKEGGKKQKRRVKNALATSPAKRAGGATALELRARLNSAEDPRMPSDREVLPASLL